ncbi:hypothetical protein BAOM_0216 [Peribacillus asahii]|uniref:Uncharacterized protein n=1 Tax=Peribacillus asahii TaxID=228899 RepID=A0A3Q9RKE8_9BACI|nr:hypothetical protein BAOM_0216 [Peribacillus asahii]
MPSAFYFVWESGLGTIFLLFTSMIVEVLLKREYVRYL